MDSRLCLDLAPDRRGSVDQLSSSTNGEDLVNARLLSNKEWRGSAGRHGRW